MSQIGDALVEFSLLILLHSWYPGRSMMLALLLATRQLTQAVVEPLSGISYDLYDARFCTFFSSLFRALSVLLFLLLRNVSGASSFPLLLLFVIVHFSIAACFSPAARILLPKYVNSSRELLSACFMETFCWYSLPGVGFTIAGMVASALAWNSCLTIAPVIYLCSALLGFALLICKPQPSEVTPQEQNLESHSEPVTFVQGKETSFTTTAWKGVRMSEMTSHFSCS